MRGIQPLADLGFIPRPGDCQQASQAKVVQIPRGQIVFLHKGSDSGHKFPEASRISTEPRFQKIFVASLQQSLDRYFAPPEESLSEDSLDTVAIGMQKTDDANSGSPEDLWKGQALVIQGVSIQLLQNQFHPSPDLGRGFSYTFLGVTLRGHERHSQAGVSAQDELLGRIDEIVKNIKEFNAQHSGIATSLRFKLLSAGQEFSNIASQHSLDQNKVDASLAQGRRKIHSTMQALQHLHLIAEASRPKQQLRDCEKAVEDAVQEFRRLNTTIFPEHLTSERLERLEQLHRHMGNGIEQLRHHVLTSQEKEVRSCLMDSFETTLTQAEKLCLEETTHSARTSVMRVYTSTPLRTPEEHLQALWELLQGMVAKTALLNFPSKESCSNKDFRDKLLQMRQAEIDLFSQEGVKEDFQANVEHTASTLVELKRVHAYWHQFSSLPAVPQGVRCVQQMQRELAQKFENVWSSDNYLLDCLTKGDGRGEKALQEKTFDIIRHLFHVLDLVEEAKILKGTAKRTEDGKIWHQEDRTPNEGVHFREALYLLISSYALSLNNPTSPDATMKLKFMLGRTAELMKEKRVYGGTKREAQLKSPIEHLDAFLDTPCRMLDQLALFLRSATFLGTGEVAKLEELSARLSAQADTLSTRVDEWKRLLDATPSSGPDDLGHFANFQRDLSSDLRGLHEIGQEIGLWMENHFPEDPQLSVAVADKKIKLQKTLPGVLSIESRRSQVYKDVNALRTIGKSEKGRNPKLRDSAAAVKEIRASLENAGTARMTEVDVEVKNAMIEQLARIEEAFLADSSEEWLKRIQAISTEIHKHPIPSENHAQVLADAVRASQISDKDDILSLLETDPIDIPNLVMPMNKHASKDDTLKPLWKNLLYSHLKTELTPLQEALQRQSAHQMCKKLRESLGHMHLGLERREFTATDHNTPFRASFGWTGSAIQEAPHYRSNETHIPL